MEFNYNGNLLNIGKGDIKEIRQTASSEVTGYLWNDQHIPIADGNTHYEMIKEYLKQGGEITPAFTEEQLLDDLKERKSKELETYSSSKEAQIVTVLKGKVVTKVVNNSSFRSWLQAKSSRYQGSEEIISYDILDDSGNIISQFLLKGSALKECSDKLEDQAEARYKLYKEIKTEIKEAALPSILAKINIVAAFKNLEKEIILS